MSAMPDIPRITSTGSVPPPDVVVERICTRFAETGVVVFEDVVPHETIAELTQAYLQGYTDYHRDMMFEDARHVGDRRNMITITLDGPFNDPMVYAPAFVMPVIKRLLGDDAILGSFVAVTSLAGSEEQHTHRDMPLLFGDDQLGAAVPAYCLTLVLPFVDMNDVNGTTAFLAGSHHAIGEEPAGIEPQAPDVGIGDVMLFDCRVWHFGTPNRSNAPRPVLYNSYQRPWFRDAINFDLQAPLTVSQRALDQVPDEHRHLFEWAMKPR